MRASKVRAAASKKSDRWIARLKADLLGWLAERLEGEGEGMDRRLSPEALRELIELVAEAAESKEWLGEEDALFWTGSEVQ